MAVLQTLEDVVCTQRRGLDAAKFPMFSGGLGISFVMI